MIPEIIPYRILRVDGSGEPGECRVMPGEIAVRRLKTIHAIVDPVIGEGNELEHVLVFWEGAYRDLFVDETGVLKGLPRNELATEIYRNNVMVHEPGKHRADDLPHIAGDAVLFEGRIWR